MTYMKKSTYRAEVMTVDPGKATVRLASKPACCGCGLAEACAEQADGETVTARFDRNIVLAPGDRVEVECPDRASSGPMLSGIVIPCVILIVLSLIMGSISDSRQLVTWVPLGAVGIYYVALLVRRRFGRRLQQWEVVRRVK